MTKFPGPPRITSRQNEIVAQYRGAARGDETGLLLLDGVHLISDALAAGITLRHVMVVPGASAPPDVHHLLDRLRREPVPIAEGSPSVMAAVSPVHTASPIVALGVPPGHTSLFDLEPALVVIACDVQDPGNLGAIARVAEAAGASGLVAAGLCAYPFSWKVLRGSMGSALRLPIAIERDPHHAIEVARRHGCRIVATVRRDGDALFGADLKGPTALLIGGEGHGLSQEVERTADTSITIPMHAPVESLNASVAAALVLYEALRQREFRIRK